MNTFLLDIIKNADVAIPEGGIKPGLLVNDITQVMTPEDAALIKEKLPWYKRTGPGLIPSSVIGGVAGNSLVSIIRGIKNKGMSGVPTFSSKGLLAGAVAVPSILYALSRMGVYDKSALDSANRLLEKANLP